MLEDPADWKKYYNGSRDEIRLDRKYSMSDRIRYYWAKPEVIEAVNRLTNNLESREISLNLLSQFLPEQYQRIREGSVKNEVQALIRDKIGKVISDYDQAVKVQ